MVVKGKATEGESVYKIITLVGTSTESWEKAAAAAVKQAAKTLQDLRIAEVKSSICTSRTAKLLHIVPESRFPSNITADRSYPHLMTADGFSWKG